jgi:hypothetical protein
MCYLDLSQFLIDAVQAKVLTVESFEKWSELQELLER